MATAALLVFCISAIEGGQVYYHLKWTYHGIFKWYIVGPYLYKVYLYVSVFKIPNRSCILAMPHFAQFALFFSSVFARADSVSCSWPRPPVGEGSRALIKSRGGEKKISVLRVLLYYYRPIELLFICFNTRTANGVNLTPSCFIFDVTFFQ